MNDNITNPLSTAIPDNAIKPTPADIESGISRNHSANTPPVSASGTPVNIINASRNEPNTTTNNTKITNKVAGTTNDKR